MIQRGRPPWLPSPAGGALRPSPHGAPPRHRNVLARTLLLVKPAALCCPQPCSTLRRPLIRRARPRPCCRAPGGWAAAGYSHAAPRHGALTRAGVTSARPLLAITPRASYVCGPFVFFKAPLCCTLPLAWAPPRAPTWCGASSSWDLVPLAPPCAGHSPEAQRGRARAAPRAACGGRVSPWWSGPNVRHAALRVACMGKGVFAASTGRPPPHLCLDLPHPGAPHRSLAPCIP